MKRSNRESDRLAKRAENAMKRGAIVQAKRLRDSAILRASSSHARVLNGAYQPNAQSPATWDVLIIGCGPAGLTAAVHSASEGLSTIALESSAHVGGQARQSSLIENFPGYSHGVSGEYLCGSIYNQAVRFGVRIETSCAVSEVIQLPDKRLLVSCSDSRAFIARAVIIATGKTWRKLDIDLPSNGITYSSALDDGARVIGESIAIIGGANSAAQSALYLSRFAARTFLLSRSALDVRMSAYLRYQIAQNPRIETREHAHVISARGKRKLTEVTISQDGKESRLAISQLFVFVGYRPATEFLPPEILDSGGKVIAPHCETAISGIFACGDCRHGATERIISATGEAATCVARVFRYLSTFESGKA